MGSYAASMDAAVDAVAATAVAAPAAAAAAAAAAQQRQQRRQGQEQRRQPRRQQRRQRQQQQRQRPTCRSRAQGRRPCRWCATQKPRSSRGTATASPPFTDASRRPEGGVQGVKSKGGWISRQVSERCATGSGSRRSSTGRQAAAPHLRTWSRWPLQAPAHVHQCTRQCHLAA